MLQRKRKKRIGQILVEAEVITEKQLNTALRSQRSNGQCLGESLIELGYIDGDEVTQYLAEQYRIPYISLDRYELSEHLLNLVPEDISRTYGLIPLDLIGNILTVGIIDVPDEETLRQMEQLIGFKIQIMLISAGDFNQYMQRIYDPSVVSNGKWFKDIKIGKYYVKTPSYNGRERRRFPRFNKDLKIKYELKDEYNINSSVNVSQGGVLIKSKTPVPVNSHIVIRMELPTSYEDVIIISRVVRVERVAEEDIYLIALNFDTMDAMDNRRLAGFIKSLRR